MNNLVDRITSFLYESKGSRKAFKHSKVSKRWKKQFSELPPKVQQQAAETFDQWRKDPSSVSFNNFSKSGQPDKWKIEIGMRWRTLGKQIDEDTILWDFIGSHEAYNKEW